MILGIDPGNIESGLTLIDEITLKPSIATKLNNEEILAEIIYVLRSKKVNHVAIEMIASYGMPVGAEVFQTCVWIGRFIQILKDKEYSGPIKYIYRKEEKMNLCNSMKARDSNIIQALVDRFAPGIPNKGKGTKKNKGWFYGFKKDIWQSYAVAVTYHDLYLENDC